MVANPDKGMPDANEKRRHMARLHMTLMHGESWFGLLQTPPPREPRPDPIILSLVQEDILDYLIEFGPSSAPDITRHYSAHHRTVLANLDVLARKQLVRVMKQRHSVSPIIWDITTEGRAAAIAPTPEAIDRQSYKHTRLAAYLGESRPISVNLDDPRLAEAIRLYESGMAFGLVRKAVKIKYNVLEEMFRQAGVNIRGRGWRRELAASKEEVKPT